MMRGGLGSCRGSSDKGTANMGAVQLRLVLGALVALVGASEVRAGNYADPSGFAFAYPEGWVVVNRDAMDDVNSALPPEIKDWVARNKYDLGRVAMILLRNGSEEFLESINVVLSSQEISTTEASVRTLIEEISGQYESMGVEIKNLKGHVERVGNRDAVVVDYVAHFPSQPDRLRQRQVLFPGGGKTYVVTCTAKTDTFNDYEPTFTQALASFQAPAPTVKRFDWGNFGRTTLARALFGGIVGLLIGGGVWLARKLTGQGKRADGNAGTPGAGAV